MKSHPGALDGLVVIEPDVHRDERGDFLETHQAERYRDHGVPDLFVQDNLSRSQRGVLRGLHLQQPHAQGKLVMVLQGCVFDVAVDVRLGSPTFARWCGMELDSESKRQVYLPPGYAHGFVVLSDEALFHYKCTDFYSRSSELTIRWDDPEIGIQWPVSQPLVSERDAAAPRLRDIPAAQLPLYAGPGEPGR